MCNGIKFPLIFLQDKENSKFIRPGENNLYVESLRSSLDSLSNRRVYNEMKAASVRSSDMNSHSAFGPAQHIIQLLKVGQLGSFYLNRLSIYFYWVSVVECIIIVNAWPLAAKLLAAKIVIGGWLAIAIQVRARPFPSHGHLRIYSLCALLYFACWNGTFVFMDFTHYLSGAAGVGLYQMQTEVCASCSSVWARPHQLMRLYLIFSGVNKQPNSAWNRTTWILTFSVSVLMPNQNMREKKIDVNKPGTCERVTQKHKFLLNFLATKSITIYNSLDMDVNHYTRI